MPPIIELIVVVVAMLGSFFLVFLLMFVLALFLAPIERSISKMVWDIRAPAKRSDKPGSFKDFSKKH
ncbi:MAG TPA: hypothetical protein VIH45_10655 [Desulfuromonadaceae bacterium]